MDINPFEKSWHSSASEGSSSPVHGHPAAPPNIPDHKLLKCVGSGSYGTVWLAQSTMGMYRAVKVVYRSSFSDQTPFERELSGLRRFEPISRSHEGFIDILQVGINQEEGYFYCIMELGDNLTSSGVIDPANYRPKTLGKEISLQHRLSFRECLELGLGLSQALAELHKRGLVHRDVKPSNIIFVNGIPKLADIGLVAEFKEARSYVGTEGFIPPEGPGTPQADVYGLGKVLYEASTGKDRKEFPDLPTHLEEFVDQHSFLELNEVILHACKSDIAKRYQSAWEMYADLLILADGKSVKRLKVLERRLSNLKRIGGVALLLFSLLGIIAYQLYQEKKAVVEAKQYQDIISGNSKIDAGDLPGALLYAADALRINGGDPSHDSALRLRFGAILAQCPKLTGFWLEPKGVYTGQFSPDGTKIVIAQEFGDTKIYDLQTARLYQHPFGSEPGLLNAAFSHDGRFVATTSQDGWVCVWDAATLAEVHRWPHPKGVFTARFSPDGHFVVTACADGVVRVWNVQTDKVDTSLPHSAAVRFADFSPDGKIIATCCEDHAARLWNTSGGQPIGHPLEHGRWVYYAAFSPDGKRVITASGARKRLEGVAKGWCETIRASQVTGLHD